MKTKFNFLGVQPPSNLFVGPDQALRVTIYNSALACECDLITRIIRADGETREIVNHMIVPGGYPGLIFFVPLTESYILSSTLICLSPNRWPGGIYAQIDLMSSMAASGVMLSQLAAGHITTSCCLSYPQSPIRHSTDIVPPLLSFHIPDPLPGDPAVMVVPAYQRFRMVGITFQYTCSIGVGNRRPYVSGSANGIQSQFYFADALLVASAFADYQFTDRRVPTVTAERVNQFMSPNLVLNPADQLEIGALAIDPLDEITNIFVEYEFLIFV